MTPAHPHKGPPLATRTLTILTLTGLADLTYRLLLRKPLRTQLLHTNKPRHP